jgi:hypothetical protein
MPLRQVHCPSIPGGAPMLEDLAFLYTQQDALVFTLLGYVLVILGAVLSASLLTPRVGKLSRSWFYQRAGVASLLLAVNQAWWLLYVPSLAAGVSWLWMVTDILGYLAYGAYLIRIAQCRSRDAYGDTARAWMILIPIANLILIFRRSQQPDAQAGSVMAALAGIAFVILSRVLNAGLMDAVETKTLADMQADPRAVAAIQSLILRHDGPEAGLDTLIQSEGAPQRLGPDLMLTSVTRQALAVTYAFRIDMADATSLDVDYRREFVSAICGAYLPFMEIGATVALHYTRPDGATVERLDLSLTTCTT